ncbi:MAG TPA: sulfide-dependent adenosine diphosphate thiazole synthase [bacterium]|nr:sulfide-dependent adenosine diphosphate thiazole synthase [bacterium]
MQQQLDEVVITRAIIDSFTGKLRAACELDAAICGAGPSGLVAATLLARAGRKVAVFESKLAPGGGMWGGGMMFNDIVVQRAARELLAGFGVRLREQARGYFVADAVEASAALVYHAVHSGALLFNCVSVADVMVRRGRVGGLVLNWTPVERLGMHVDPLIVRARVVADSTGHPASICSLLAKKNGVRLRSATGGVIGERSLDATRGEAAVVRNTRAVYPGLYVSGMAANAVAGAARMGPVFGGMLLSGQKLAQLMLRHQ